MGLPIGGPLRRAFAGRMFGAAGRRVGGDLRATEPRRMIRLVEPVPLLLIHGAADRTVPPADGRRLAALAGPTAEHWEVPGAGHGGARRAAPAPWDERVSAFLRSGFSGAREAVPIIHASGEPTAEFDPQAPEGD
jgi:pimeloyl-ACP methyl ester carboxylesterase